MPASYELEDVSRKGEAGVGSVTIRALKRRDMPEILALLRTRGGADEDAARKRAELFEWLAFHNPFAGREATYFVAVCDGRIVAFHGRMPTLFSMQGERRMGYYVHDLYVHPDYRKRGMGLFLTMELAKAIENESRSFFCLVGMTGLNRLMQRRRGYVERLPETFVRPLKFRSNPIDVERKYRWLSFLSWLPRIVMSILDMLCIHCFTPHHEVVEVQRFDESVDRLFESIAPKLGISAWKSSEYLNWKYMERPFKRESGFVVRENGDLRGFMVLGVSPYGNGSKPGVILELIADPDDTPTIHDLCMAAIRHFRQRGVESIRCTMTDKRFVKVMKRQLFYRDSWNRLLMLGNLDRVPGSDRLTNIANWHLTRGESDAFMLS